MRVVHIASLISAAVLVAVAPAEAGAQQGAVQAGHPTASRPAASDSGYSGKESDFVVGKRVYLRSTKTFIGTIIDVDDAHHFPPERFPRAEMKAVLLVRRDGPYDWVPLQGLTKIYVAR